MVEDNGRKSGAGARDAVSDDEVRLDLSGIARPARVTGLVERASIVT